MKITYDPRADAMYIQLKSAHIADTDEVAPGYVMDFDEQGKVVGIEILVASKQVDDPRAHAQILNGPGRTVRVPPTRATA